MGLRYLGVDPGRKRIGLAVADPETGVVSPLRTLAASGTPEGDAQRILAAAREYASEAIVVGLPLNMDDSAGPQARQSMALAEALRAAGSLVVLLHDERLTSHAADGRLAHRGLTRAGRRERQDSVAAAIMLESFLKNRKDQEEKQIDQESKQ